MLPDNLKVSNGVNAEPKPGTKNDSIPWELAGKLEEQTSAIAALVSLLTRQSEKRINAEWRQVNVNSGGILPDLQFDYSVMTFYVDNSQNANEFSIQRSSGGLFTVGAYSQGYVYPLGGNFFKVVSAPSATVYLQGIDTLIRG